LNNLFESFNLVFTLFIGHVYLHFLLDHKCYIWDYYKKNANKLQNCYTLEHKSPILVPKTCWHFFLWWEVQKSQM